WYLTASIPYLDRVHRHIANESGLFPVLQTWTYRGIGDGTLLANWTALGTGDPSSSVTVVLQAGAKLPTGARHIESVDGEQPEPHARLGTGSWDVLVGGHAMHFVN